MAFKSVIEEIIRLSQEEGLKDDEIAQAIGCSRATVNRERQKHNIPKADLSNRMDKEYTCTGCYTVVKIRRKERRQLYCPDCKEKIKNGTPLPNVM